MAVLVYQGFLKRLQNVKDMAFPFAFEHHLEKSVKQRSGNNERT